MNARFQTLSINSIQSVSNSPFNVVSDIHQWPLTEMFSQSAASMRSGKDQSQAYADASPWGSHEKRQQYLSHLWLLPGLGTMLSLWCGFISLQLQPRMVAVLWWPLHKSVLVLSLVNVAWRELDKRRTNREKGDGFHRKVRRRKDEEVWLLNTQYNVCFIPPTT